MTIALRAAMLLAAMLFIMVSATMNAIFLSSLGRTAIECALFAIISVAADIVKAVLPVLIMRAVMLRAWGQCLAAVMMLSVVDQLA